MADYDFINTKFISWFSDLESRGEGEYREKRNEFRLGVEGGRHFAIGTDEIGRPMIGALGLAYEAFCEMEIESAILLKKIPFNNIYGRKEFGDYLLFRISRITDDDDAPANPFSVYVPANPSVIDYFYWLDRPKDMAATQRLCGLVEVSFDRMRQEITQITPVGEEKEFPVYRDGNWKGVAEKVRQETGFDLKEEMDRLSGGAGLDEKEGVPAIAGNHGYGSLEGMEALDVSDDIVDID